MSTATPSNALRGAILAIAALAGTPAHADENAVPYWASVDTDLANMRVGPGEHYQIDWVYKRRHLPVKVVRREGPWRLIEDPDGTRGWMRDLLLSRERSAIVTDGEPAEMRQEATATSRILWRVEAGVVGLLGECQGGWCPFEVTGRKGFVRQERLWGAAAP